MPENNDERERVKRDSFERVAALMEKLGIKEYVEEI